MPTNTFFNLPIEKKKKIMNAAKSEFVEYSFYDASINRIIKNAGISRGSFYMYFENKEDLFLYILDGYREEVLAEIVKGVNGEVFEIIKKAHKLPFELGCERVITTVRIDEKFGGLTINDKLKNHRQV